MLNELFKTFDYSILNEDLAFINSVISNNLSSYKNNDRRMRATIILPDDLDSSNSKDSGFSNNNRAECVFIDMEKARHYIMSNGFIMAGVTNIYASWRLTTLKVKLGWIKSTNIKRSYAK